MPTLFSPDGRPYRTENPVEITRLKLAQHYTEAPPTEATDPAPRSFHPADHTVDEVQAYLAEHKDNEAETNRVLTEEAAGQGRKGIVGE